MTRELYIDNQRVDLPDDVRFQLTFEIAKFGEIRTVGSGSNTIKLPKTPRNIAIFENCNFVQVNSAFPYVVHSAYYYEDGWLIFRDATVYMLAITERDFEIQCVWGNSNTIRELKAIDLWDVAGLGGINCHADAYGMIDTGIDQFTDKGLIADYTRGLLSIEKTLEILGIDINKDSNFYNYYIKDLYVFPNMNTIKVKANFTKNGTYSGTIREIGSPGDKLLACAASFKPTEIKIFDSWNNRDVYLIPIVSNKTIDCRIKINVQDTEIKKGKVTISLSTINGYIWVMEEKDVNINSSGSFSTNFIITITYSNAKAVMVSFLPSNNSTEAPLAFQYSCEVSVQPANFEDVKEEYEVQIEMPKYDANAPEHFPVLFSDALSGVNAYDFVKACFENSGCIIENLNNNIEIYTYNDIADNTENIKDWSDKLVYIKDEVFNSEFGAKNYVKYKSSDKYNGYGDGYFVNELANKLEKADKTIVENSLFSFNNGAPLGRNYAMIPMFTNKDGSIEFSGDGGFWLVKLGDLMDYYLINSDELVIQNAQVRGVPQQPTFSNISQYVWSEYIGIQNSYRKVKAVFNLKPADINGFSFKNPIYLKQYAQSYIVTKINYQPNASTVEMLLIR